MKSPKSSLETIKTASYKKTGYEVMAKISRQATKKITSKFSSVVSLYNLKLSPLYTSSILTKFHPENCITILCSCVPWRNTSTLGARA